jgi:hypothetical protein
LAAARPVVPNTAAAARLRLQRQVLDLAATGKLPNTKIDPEPVLMAEDQDRRGKIVAEAVKAAQHSDRVIEVLVARNAEQDALISACQRQHQVNTIALHRLIKETDPVTAGGHALVDATALATGLLELYATVLLVENRGTPGGLARYLTFVKTMAIHDGAEVHGGGASTRFGPLDTPEFILAVLAEVDPADVWCPRKSESTALADQLVERMHTKRMAGADMGGQSSLAAAERASAQLG